MFLAINCADADLSKLVGYIKLAYTIIQIAVPIVLIIMGSLDLLKAVSSGDDKAVKAATSMLGKRAGAAVGVFILFMVVRLLTGVVGGDEWKTCWNAAGTATIGGNTTEEQQQGQNQ